jgi:glycosyltransferase involved in cell wall biosynthesis
MELFFVYAGRRGGGLESTLTVYEIARKLGIDAKLILSKDNERAQKIRGIFPEAEFYDFFSIPDLLKLKKRLESGVSFFGMVSPKMFPLFLSLKSKKIFYFHATYDYSFSSKGISDRTNDFMHDKIISSSTLTVATQWPLAWQIRHRLGVRAEVLPHPPYASIRKGFFQEDRHVDLPIEKFFLNFGGIDRFSKGTDVLLEAAKGARFSTVLAGRAARNLSSKNIVHLDRWLDNGEMHNLIKRSKAVVLPYLVSSQFSGCMTLAFLFGIPVIAPFSPSFKDWVDEGKTGWFFSSGDSDDLRDVMERVWSGKAKFSKAAIARKDKEMELKTREKLKEILDKVGM